MYQEFVFIFKGIEKDLQNSNAKPYKIIIYKN